MESNYNNREFEQYIKKNADQYRMIPSEKVWKGINGALHTRRRWYGVGLSLLLLLTAVSVTWVMMTYPGKTSANVNPEQVKVTKETTSPANQGNVLSGATAPNDINDLLSIRKFDAPYPATIVENSTIEEQETISLNPDNTGEVFFQEIASRPVILSHVRNLPAKSVNSADVSEVAAPVFNLTGENERSLLMNNNPGKAESNKSNQNTVYSPLTIESVVTSYKPIRLPKTISWQVYITPTISYRKLSANKSFDNSSPFANPVVYPFTAFTDVNKAVTHKPDMGLQLGFFAKYPLTKALKLRAGLQFNINKYDIKAYKNYSGEQATIDLNGDDASVTAWTYYRNYSGYKTDWLKNYYFSVSAPIGAELTVFGNNKTSFGVASTIQPTYILRDKAYLISTDYKNYAKVPWLVRRVNVNTSFETFVNFTSRNKTRWQIGPQVRYQVLSSFNNQYPVRENLFDFGLRMGISLNQ